MEIPGDVDDQLVVLVVDDNQDGRVVAQRILENAQFSVRTAEDGEAALAVLDQEPVDLIVTDIAMPR